MKQPVIRAFRYVLGTVLLVALPTAGYLVGEGKTIFASLCLAGLAAAAGIELLARSEEATLDRLHERARDDELEFRDWKEKVRLLDGVVKILQQDSADLRRGKLVGEITLETHQMPSRQLAITENASTD